MESRPILVVDDDARVRDVIGEILKRQGFQIIEASDGATALSLLHELDGRVSLVVTDVVMPGMSGVEAAAKIKERHPSVPVLVVTGYAELAGDANADGLVRKPFTDVTLVQAVLELYSDSPGELPG